MSDDDNLPTLGQLVSNWLGVQLPTVPMPQTLKNVDKAVAKIILASGENLEARIRTNTAKAKAIGKINVEGLFRTQEEQRKLTNRAAVTRAALEDLDSNANSPDAPSEIDDDWLNVFARLSEDKSSEELQLLFGKILSGEIRRPGSFSLRTIQIMTTISKQDAESLSRLLSYAINGLVIPFFEGSGGCPTTPERLFLEELGVAGHPSHIGGVQLTVNLAPGWSILMGSHLAVSITNTTTKSFDLGIPGQALTSSAREMLKIANPPATDIEFLKRLADNVRAQLRQKDAPAVDGGFLTVQVVKLTPFGNGQTRYDPVYTSQT